MWFPRSFPGRSQLQLHRDVDSSRVQQPKFRAIGRAGHTRSLYDDRKEEARRVSPGDERGSVRAVDDPTCLHERPPRDETCRARRRSRDRPASGAQPHEAREGARIEGLAAMKERAAAVGRHVQSVGSARKAATPRKSRHRSGDGSAGIDSDPDTLRTLGLGRIGHPAGREVEDGARDREEAASVTNERASALRLWAVRRPPARRLPRRAVQRRSRQPDVRTRTPSPSNVSATGKSGREPAGRSPTRVHAFVARSSIQSTGGFPSAKSGTVMPARASRVDERAAALGQSASGTSYVSQPAAVRMPPPRRIHPVSARITARSVPSAARSSTVPLGASVTRSTSGSRREGARREEEAAGARSDGVMHDPFLRSAPRARRLTPTQPASFFRMASAASRPILTA